MTAPDHFDVFLSYSSGDIKAAKRLGRGLRGRGLKVWLDEWELEPGRKFQAALQKVLPSTRSVLVVIGESRGPWQEAEVEVAISQSKKRPLPVIPVLLPTVSEPLDLGAFLEEFSRIDLRSVDTEKAVDKIYWGITGKKPAPRWRRRVDATATALNGQEPDTDWVGREWNTVVSSCRPDQETDARHRICEVALARAAGALDNYPPNLELVQWLWRKADWFAVDQHDEEEIREAIGRFAEQSAERWSDEMLADSVRTAVDILALGCGFDIRLEPRLRPRCVQALVLEAVLRLKELEPEPRIEDLMHRAWEEAHRLELYAMGQFTEGIQTVWEVLTHLCEVRALPIPVSSGEEALRRLASLKQLADFDPADRILQLLLSLFCLYDSRISLAYTSSVSLYSVSLYNAKALARSSGFGIKKPDILNFVEVEKSVKLDAPLGN